jgi:hypothetical protein
VSSDDNVELFIIVMDALKRHSEPQRKLFFDARSERDLFYESSWFGICE